MEITLNHYLILSALLFCIGLYGLITRNNAFRVLMSIEVILNAININFVAFAHYIDPIMVKGQVFSLFVMAVAAAEADGAVLCCGRVFNAVQQKKN